MLLVVVALLFAVKEKLCASNSALKFDEDYGVPSDEAVVTSLSNSS